MHGPQNVKKERSNIRRTKESKKSVTGRSGKPKSYYYIIIIIIIIIRSSSNSSSKRTI